MHRHAKTHRKQAQGLFVKAEHPSESYSVWSFKLFLALMQELSADRQTS